MQLYEGQKLRNYKDDKYKKWQRSVFKRDKYKCQWPACHHRGRIEAHHIKKWSDFPALRYQVVNGITLCKKHHRMITGKEEEFEAFFYTILGREWISTIQRMLYSRSNNGKSKKSEQ